MKAIINTRTNHVSDSSRLLEYNVWNKIEINKLFDDIERIFRENSIDFNSHTKHSKLFPDSLTLKIGTGGCLYNYQKRKEDFIEVETDTKPLPFVQSFNLVKDEPTYDSSYRSSILNHFDIVGVLKVPISLMVLQSFSQASQVLNVFIDNEYYVKVAYSNSDIYNVRLDISTETSNKDTKVGEVTVNIFHYHITHFIIYYAWNNDIDIYKSLEMVRQMLLKLFTHK